MGRVKYQGEKKGGVSCMGRVLTRSVAVKTALEAVFTEQAPLLI